MPQSQLVSGRAGILTSAQVLGVKAHASNLILYCLYATNMVQMKRMELTWPVIGQSLANQVGLETRADFKAHPF